MTLRMRELPGVTARDYRGLLYHLFLLSLGFLHPPPAPRGPPPPFLFVTRASDLRRDSSKHLGEPICFSLPSSRPGLPPPLPLWPKQLRAEAWVVVGKASATSLPLIKQQKRLNHQACIV